LELVYDPEATDILAGVGRCGASETANIICAMGISIRHVLVDENDEVFRLSNRLFERLWEGSPGGVLPRFAGRRVRSAELAVLMQDYKPVAVVWVAYSYLSFDAQGRLDRDRLMRNAALKTEAAAGDILPERSETVIHASSRFAARRRDHEAVWTPSAEIEDAIHAAALGSRKTRRP
jgi:hypothetical protein